ncbi:MAG: glutamine amidotransferase [Verrucomicrobiota bacterium]
MMFLATLVIAGKDWLLPAGIFLALVVVSLFFGYRGANADKGIRVACVFLKLLGVSVLLACLLEPLWSGQRARPGANHFVVMADNSQGMNIKDAGELKSRAQNLQALLTDEKSTWQDKLNENFQTRRYLFDARVQSVNNFGDLTFDGRVSSLGTALRTVGERYAKQPLGGVLLFTDGNATDAVEESLDGLPPVYPVVVGNDKTIKDLSVVKVTTTQTSFEDAPVTVQVEVSASGYSGQILLAQLIEVGRAALPPVVKHGEKKPVKKAPADTSKEKEKIVASQTQRVQKDQDTVTFRFQQKPESGGISYYRVQVSARGETDQFKKPELSSEATVANNRRFLALDRGKGPYRILYVGGRPNWEYKFLNRALNEDDQLELVSLIRAAKREPKFQYKGRQGEESNPLFRGFDRKTEETERYDKPVLIRLNTRDELELRDGFPRAAETLFEYHAVVLDDLESEFFSHDQMSLLQRFVSERGGGLLMLGGQESLNQGHYENTPIGTMLPVYLDGLGHVEPLNELKLSLTREGWLQPWIRLRSNEQDERKRLEEMAPFQVMNRVRSIKPGANVLATVADNRGVTHPALAAQRYGSGRTAVVTIGDLWRWGLRDESQQDDLGKAWRQMMRWLVSDVASRIEISADVKRDDPNHAVVLQVRAREKDFKPLDNATVTLTVRPVASEDDGKENPEAHRIKLTAEPSLAEPGLYQATYIPRDTGGYVAEASVTDAVGKEVGRVQAGWTTDFAAEEFQSLRPNVELLKTIAAKTGGRVVSMDDLESFASELPNLKVPITESWTFPLWHRSLVFLFALICLAAEWGLRRWKGMA